MSNQLICKKDLINFSKDLYQKNDFEEFKKFKPQSLITKEEIINGDRFRSNIIKKRQKEDKLFLNFLQEYILMKEKVSSKSCISQFITIYNHFERFQEEKKITLYTDSIGSELLEEFISYLRQRNMLDTSIKNLVQRVKFLCRKMSILGYQVNPTFDDVTLKSDESFAIYLTSTQIHRIYYFSDVTPEQYRIKQMFVLQCYTGLRYSDLCTLCEEDIDFDKKMIVKKQKKTHEIAYIPLSPIVKKIMEDFNYILPQTYTLQHYNRTIKEILRKIGDEFLENISYERLISNKLEKFSQPLFSLVSSHTARRSFLSNLLMSGNVSGLTLSMYSGHRSETNLMKYLKISKEYIANTISNNMYLQK